MSYMAAGPVPVHTGEGKTLAGGETAGADFDPEDETNRRHIAAGRLVEYAGEATPPSLGAEPTEEQLAAFLETATVKQVIEAASTPELASALLDSENSRDEPRKGVVDGLTNKEKSA